MRHSVWLCFRLSLSFRELEGGPAQRGVDVTYETIPCWTNKFGPPPRAPRADRPRPAPTPPTRPRPPGLVEVLDHLDHRLAAPDTS